MLVRLVAIAGLLSLAAAAPGARAIDPDTPLAQLQQRIWTRMDGVPGDPTYVTRTTDGFIWTFSAAGIHQFDGTAFEPFVPTEGPAPRSARVRLVRPDERGGLWIGYFDGGATHILAGKVRAWPADDGPLAGFSVRTIAFDAQGRAHFGGSGGLLRLDGDGQWRRVPLHGDGSGDGQVDSLSFASDGRLWVMAQSGLWVREGNADDGFRKLRDGEPTAQISGIVSAPNGDTYTWNMHDPRGLCRIHPGDRAGCWDAPGMALPVFDQEGAMWWGDQVALFRVARPHSLRADQPEALAPAIERLPLGTNRITPSPDGSLWIAAEGTIVRLRESPVRVARLPSGGLAAAEDGQLWVASFSRGLMRVGTGNPGEPLLAGQDGTLWTSAAAGTPMGFADGMTFAAAGEPAGNEPVVLSRHAEAGRGINRIMNARDGALWVSTIYPEPALSRVHGGRVEHVPLPPLERGAAPRGVFVDRAGDVWLGVQNNPSPFFRRQGGAWQENAGMTVPENVNSTFALDGLDRGWLTGGESVHLYSDGAWRRFSTAEGLDVGATSTALEFGGQVWVLGQGGVAGFTGDGFSTLVGTGGRRFVGVTGFVQRSNGDLWMFGADGVTRIAAEEWKRSLAEPGREVAFSRLDHLDGITVSPMSGAPLPSVAETTDGRLWFAGSSRLFWLDPETLLDPLPPPPVVFRRFEVDDHTLPPRDGTRLPVGTTRVSLAFAAPSAELAERTRFRYRLVTDDDEAPSWQSAGDRREVVYHRLPPGEYRFEVVASGRDGHWAGAPTSMGFAIEPAFHQTRAFLVLVTLAALLLLAAAWIFRLRQVSMRIRTEMGARMAEREQISRDLHDTLLQGVQALLLNFQAIANRFPVDDPHRRRMESALDRAQEVVREGRDRIGALREPDVGPVDLAGCLDRHGRELASETGIGFALDVSSPPRPLQPGVHGHLLQIGREALTNAFRHAAASQVWLRLHYDDQGVSLLVGDDGRGFPEDVRRAGRREGHWGLAGMRERAQLAGGTLELRTREGGGAEVAMRVPAPLAYAGPRRPRFGIFRSGG